MAGPNVRSGGAWVAPTLHVRSGSAWVDPASEQARVSGAWVDVSAGGGIPAVAYVDEVLADGPMGYWRGGVAVPAVIDALLDDSGTLGNDLKLWHDTGATSYPKDGVSLLASDANPSIDMVPDSNFWDPTHIAAFDTTGGISVECWCKPRSGSLAGTTFHNLITKANKYGINIAHNGTNYVFRAFVESNTTGTHTADSPAAVVAGTNYHLVMTYDKTNLKLYINGALVTTISATGNLALGGADSVVIGQAVTTANGYDGLIDEVAIYFGALAADRILAHYEAGIATGSPPDPLAGLSRVPWEGGPAYWTVAANGTKMTKADAAGWDSPSFFPIGTWRSNPSDSAALAAAGINVMIGPNEGGDIDDMTSNGMFIIPMFGEWEADASNAAIVGWLCGDEPEMDPTWSSVADWQADVADQRSTFPTFFTMTNFGNGVLSTFWWGGDGEMEDAVQSVDICSADQYYYTSPGVRNNAVNPYGSSTPADGWPLTGGSSHVAEAKKSGSYGWMITRLREFSIDSAGALRPFGVFIETQMPLLTDDDREIILYAQIRGAVWSALCNEARTINYFQHNGFYDSDSSGPGVPDIDYHMSGGNDPNTGTTPNYAGYSLVSGDAALRTYVGTLNSQIHALAPVLNRQSYVWSFGATGITTMLKEKDGYIYIFASVALGGATGSKTFTLPSGVSGTSVEVINESRSLTVTSGSFTDTFSNDYSQHNYKIAI